MDNEKILCECLYESILNGRLDCLFDENTGEGLRPLYQYEQLRDIENFYYEELLDDYENVYSRLVILSNEMMIIDKEEVHRVIKVICSPHDSHEFDTNWLKVAEKLPITVWATCYHDANKQNYYIYYNGILIMKEPCPPLIMLLKTFLLNGRSDMIILDASDMPRVVYHDDFIENRNWVRALKKIFDAYSMFFSKDKYMYKRYEFL